VSSSPNDRALSSRILQKQRELVVLNPVDSSHVMEKLWQLSQLIWNEHHCSISINERYSFRDRSPNRQKTLPGSANVVMWTNWVTVPYWCSQFSHSLIKGNHKLLIEWGISSSICHAHKRTKSHHKLFISLWVAWALALDSGLQTGRFIHQMLCGHTWLPAALSETNPTSSYKSELMKKVS
jgi:hypothetical protein